MSNHVLPLGHRTAAAILAVFLGLGALVGVAASPPAEAAVEPDPRTLPTVTARPQATWQTNGVVYAVETVGDVVYAGGNFTAVRPPGAAPGEREVRRKNIAAFDAATGQLLPFSHDFRAPDYPVPSSGSYDKTCSPGSTSGTYTCDTVYEIRSSRDGGTIYVGGDFTQVDGRARGNLAAFSTAGDALLDWRVTGIAGRVRSLAVSQDTVYFGGLFTRAGGEPRSRLAAVSATTGDLLPWAPTADDLVLTMELAGDDSRVVLGGDFDTVNGIDIHGLAAVSATGVGESTRWDSRPIPPTSYVTDLSVDGDVVYASANGEGGGVFDGRLAAETHTGRLLWRDTCLGATWAIEVAGDLVYSGSHAHDCSSTAGGFPESWSVSPPAVPRYYRLLAQTRSGEHAPFIQHWFPTTNGGIVGRLGPRDLTWTGEQLWVAGEFTTVNGSPQQGLTRFAMPPAADGVRPDRPTAPTVTSLRPGEVRVSWPATEDLDSPILTYTILRGLSTGAMTPVGTVEAASKPWHKPTLRFQDTTAVSGQEYVYQVQAADPTGQTSTRSWPTSVTVATSDVDAYADAVLDSDPALYWRLDDAAGSTRVAPTVGDGGLPGSGTTFGVPGAVVDVDPGNTAVGTSGDAAGTIGTERPEPGPGTFTAEVWFRTTGAAGGKLLGFGNRQSGSSTNYDRHVYMQPDGRLVFGVHPGGVRTVTSQAGYADGRWHHLVASLGSSGMRMSVDGSLVASRSDVTTAQDYLGYWRLGSDNLNGWPGASTSNFRGELDEFAVYDRELPAEEVVAHRVAGAADDSAPSTPTLTSGGAGGTSVVLGWSASTDDVLVADYEVHRLPEPGAVPGSGTLATVTAATSVTVPDVPAGEAYWTVVARDHEGNRSDPAVPRRIEVDGPAPYAEAVLADGPDTYWRLDDPVGSATGEALVGPAGEPDTGATFGAPGVSPGGTAVSTDGTTRGVVASTAAVPGPQEFTAEAWFQTTTDRGGKILGFGNARFQTSSNYDRHVYMRDDGTLVFGVYPGRAVTLTTSRGYNDGQWHHVAASLGPDGMRLMVDGAVVGTDVGVTSAQDYTGYWRIGGDTTWGGASSHFLAGTIDELATYPRQLPEDAVRRHVEAAGQDSEAPTAPGAPEVQVRGDDAELTWAAATDNLRVTSYEVHRAATADFTPAPATLVTSVASTTAAEADVPEGTWYYRVVALDAAGNSSPPSAATRMQSTAPDTTAPTAPGDPVAEVTDRRVALTWAASTDDVAVDGYEVHRGAAVDFSPTAATLVGSPTTTSFAEDGVPAGSWYYRVVATDAAGNRSDASAAAPAVIAGDPVEVVLGADADAWVDSTQPTRNFGGAWALTTDAQPAQQAHLRFRLPAAPPGRELVGAVLRIGTTTQSWSGSPDAVEVRSSTDAGWSESALTWENRPAPTGPVLGTLAGGSTSDTGYDVALDAAALGAHLASDVDLVLTTSSSNGVQVVSSEGAAARRPQLTLLFD